jgi:hypothetical protein
MGRVATRKGDQVTPIFVNTFNRLTTTRILCEQIAALDNAVPVIIDNASTWEPLLEWYDDCPFEVIRLRENLGHHAPWLSGVVGQDSSPVYGVTDCDLDLTGVPVDAIEMLTGPVRRGYIKCGLSLRIDDLPPWQAAVKTWESRWWKRSSHAGRFYHAAIDTTFALYRSDTAHAICMQVVGVPSLRSAPPYTARHVPWYLDGENLDEENANYFATANASNSWRPHGKQLSAPYTGRRRHAPRRV